MGISMKELKKNRLTPAEKLVLEVIDGVKSKKYPSGDVDWYNRDGVWLFQQNFENGCLSVSNLEIWSELVFGFKLKDNEVFDLLTNLLYDYTDKGKLKIVYY